MSSKTQGCKVPSPDLDTASAQIWHLKLKNLNIRLSQYKLKIKYATSLFLKEHFKN